MTEQQLTRAIIDAVNDTRRVHVWRHQSGRVRVRGGWMHLAPMGAPDIVGYTLDTGRFVGLEVKLPDEEPTSIQSTWLEQIALAGGVAACVWSVSDALIAITTKQKEKANKQTDRCIDRQAQRHTDSYRSKQIVD